MVDYNKLKQLREETGISFSSCKKALEESNDNIAKAKELLKQWGEVTVAKKAGRETAQGSIFTYVHHNRKIASMVELLCETDFVSGNEEFRLMGQEIAMQAATIRSAAVDEFLQSEYIRDPSKKVIDLIKEAVMKFGENIKLNRILRWQIGE